MIGSSSNKAHSRVRPLCVLFAMLLIQAAAVTVFAQNNVQHEYVDLGLSVKWATCNVGADKPEDAGDHYAWGEVEPKDEYSWYYYKFNHLGELCKYNRDDKKTTLDPEDDVAHVKWGGSWRMPTHDEFVELSENCTWTWYKSGNSEFSGVPGYKVTGKRDGYTDRFIFLPVTESSTDRHSNYTSYSGEYWSSSLNKSAVRDANYLYFGVSENVFTHLCYRRFYGYSVRPVCP